MRGAVPAVAVEQFGRRVVQEREEQAFWRGAVERLLEGPPRGARVAERVTGDRLEQERLDVPQMGVRHHDRAVDDGCEHGGRRRRVILGEPQRCLGDAGLAPVALRSVQVGEGLLDALGLARAHERLQQVRAQPRGERVRRDERVGQPFGRLEGAQRGVMAAADEFEHAAAVVQPHPGGRLGFGADGALGLAECPLCVLDPSLGYHRHAEG